MLSLRQWFKLAGYTFLGGLALFDIWLLLVIF